MNPSKMTHMLCGHLLGTSLEEAVLAGKVPWAPRDWLGEEKAEAKSLTKGAVPGRGGWGADLELFAFVWPFAQEILPEPFSGIPAGGRRSAMGSCPQEATFGGKQADRPDDTVISL